MKHEKLIFRLFIYICLSTSIRCETVEMVRDEGFNPDHYYARARTQLIIDLAVVGHKREEEKREETREKAISVFLA